MNLINRKELLVRLGNYMQSADEEWQQIKNKAYLENRWFTPEFTELSINNIVQNYLQPNQLEQLITQYQLPEKNNASKKIGVVMAGNIPLVGFHDLLCVFFDGSLRNDKNFFKRPGTDSTSCKKTGGLE